MVKTSKLVKVFDNRYALIGGEVSPITSQNTTANKLKGFFYAA